MSKMILIITDEESIDEGLVKMLDSWGYKTRYFSTSKPTDLEDIRPDLIIMNVKASHDTVAETVLSAYDSPTIYINRLNEESGHSMDTPLILDKPLNDEKLKFAAEMVVYHAKTDKKLRQNETYKMLYENAPMAYQSLDEDGNILEVNETWLEKLGYKRDEVISRWFGDFLEPKQVDSFMTNFPLFKVRGETAGVEFDLIRADNSRITVSFDGKVGYDSNGNFKQTHCIFKDITEQKKAEMALKESEQYYKTIFENTGTATIIVEEDSTISLANTEFEKLYGKTREEIEGKLNWTTFISDKHLPKMQEYHRKRRISPEKVPRNYEFDLFDCEGNLKNMFVTVAIIPGTTKSLVSLQDVTHSKAIENALKTSVHEKDTLLREIHHRVKNNLQIISSLLSLQSRYIEDAEALDVFKESQNRVRSMAIIHEKLYKSDKMSRIDFGDYIKDLSESLFYNYHVEPQKIRLNSNIENIFFDVDTSIPCGLIVNELITNCVKHAFPNDKTGEITINLDNNQGLHTLKVMDNGVGFPEDTDFRNTDSLGLQLVTNLVNQLDGTIELENNGGTSVIIQFNELVYDNRS